MIEITAFTQQYLTALEQTFGERVWFVGLQGSYARGEATEKSDIDMVVILDELSVSDVGRYHTMLDALPYREKLCGFLSGKDEILNWETADLFQFYHDTRPIKGSLDDLLPRIDETAVARAIKTGVCNLYHGCVHNMLYEKSDDIVKGLYKSASFVIQAMHFQQTGEYLTYQKALSAAVAPDDKVIVDTAVRLKNGGAGDFQPLSEALFAWAKAHIGQ